MKPSRLVAVEHITLEAPLGIESMLRWFYGEVGRLEEVTGMSLGGGVHLCFRSARLELRIRCVPHPDVDPTYRRLTVAVPSLREAAEQLDEKSIGYVPVSGFTYTDRRIATSDPAGNRVELKQEWPEAPL